MHVALYLFLPLCAVSEAPNLENLDFRLGSLKGWKGEGFYVTTGTLNGPSSHLGLCSSDRGTPGVTGLVERTFTVPSDAHYLTCKAFASRSPKKDGEKLLDIRLETAQHAVLSKEVQSTARWQATATIQVPDKGNPRNYRWDLSSYRGQVLRLVVVDDDNRPGSHLFTNGFQIDYAPVDESETFAEAMVKLSTRDKLSPMARFDSKHFTALSNADDDFSRQYLLHGELIYDQFLDHFRSRGFPLSPPSDRLMVAVFDTQLGFDAYMGRKMPAGIAGLYDRATNRLVVFDYGSNPAYLNQRQQAQQAAKTIPSDLERKKYLGTTTRQARDFRNDANISTIMHEVAHQLSFNTGMLNRKGDVPVWLAEGLACYCEPTDHGIWVGIGEPNYERLHALVLASQGGNKLMPLKDLVSSDNWMGPVDAAGANRLADYGQSWALFKMLMEQRPKALRAYLKLIETRTKPTTRLADFGQVFGTDLSALEQKYHDYVAVQIKQFYKPRKE